VKSGPAKLKRHHDHPSIAPLAGNIFIAPAIVGDE
jgi:hypothetical protein